MKPIAILSAGLVTLAAAGSGGFSVPKPPAPPKPPRFEPAPPGPYKPFKHESVYSNRGGVNSYPAPAKPKGYIKMP